jgi:hypothetical protein
MAPPLSPRPRPRILLISLVPVASWFVVRPLLDPLPPLPALWASVGFSIFAFLAAFYLVPALGPTFVKANLKGKDLLKVYSDPMSVSCRVVRASMTTDLYLKTRESRPCLRVNIHPAIDPVHSFSFFCLSREPFRQWKQSGRLAWHCFSTS